jgi:hypothetical protein
MEAERSISFFLSLMSFLQLIPLNNGIHEKLNYTTNDIFQNRLLSNVIFLTSLLANYLSLANI